MALLALVGTLLATAAAQVSYKKYSLSRRREQLLITVALFGATPLLTYIAVKAYGIGLVYISTGVTYVLVSAAAWRIFGERPTSRQVVAMLFILVGIATYGIGL